ncbi:CaiB/BaiF CoA transferase family protein [Chloroflexota bacterium]
MHRPLGGIRVVEWGIFHAGPGSTAILCDMGAEVIKIEQVVTGDPWRQSWRYKDINFALPSGGNIAFEGANRGKKSITIDLEHDQGKEIVYNLVKKSDIFFTNLRRSTILKMNMDYPSLSKINPKLIYASVSSYGTRGPDAGQGGFDYHGQARSGMMYSTGEPDMPPLVSQFGVVDQATAIMSSYQMVIALLMRERFGIGQEVDVSLLSTASYLLYLNNLTALLTGYQIPRHEQATADALRNYYQCQDGRRVMINQPFEDNWGTVCQLLGQPELENDPRFNCREKRMEFSTDLVSIFNRVFASKPRDEWLRLFGESNLNMCAVNTTMEAIKDPQMIENEYIVDFQHPELGQIGIPGFPIRFSAAEINNNLAAPKLGEHTEEVLREIGGYSKEEIDQFRQNGVI